MEEVNQYYLRNNTEKMDLFESSDPSGTIFTAKRVQDSIKQALKERDYAERGLVEFYSPIDYLIENLKEVGFETRYQSANPDRTVAPMINIYARKRTGRG